VREETRTSTATPTRIAGSALACICCCGGGVVTLSIKSNLRAMQKKLEKLTDRSRKHMAFALKAAATTIEDVGKQQISKNLNYANPNTRRGTLLGTARTLFVSPATLKAAVWIRDESNDPKRKSWAYLRHHDEGGTRGPVSGRHLAVPSRVVPRSAGVIPHQLRPLALHKKIGPQPTTRVWHRQRRSPATVRSKIGAFVVFKRGRFLMARMAQTQSIQKVTIRYKTASGKVRSKGKDWRWRRDSFLLWTLVRNVRLQPKLKWTDEMRKASPNIVKAAVAQEIRQAWAKLFSGEVAESSVKF